MSKSERTCINCKYLRGDGRCDQRCLECYPDHKTGDRGLFEPKDAADDELKTHEA